MEFRACYASPISLHGEYHRKPLCFVILWPRDSEVEAGKLLSESGIFARIILVPPEWTSWVLPKNKYPFKSHEDKSFFAKIRSPTCTTEQPHETQPKQGLSTQKTASGVSGRSASTKRSTDTGPGGLTKIEFGRSNLWCAQWKCWHIGVGIN